MAVSWNYYDKYNELINHYMPFMGEGDTQASQICTAVNKLIYKWYNDGDVFDNTHNLVSWCNDLSSYANWLWLNCPEGVVSILDRIRECCTEDDYEELLKDLADYLLGDEDWLYFMSHRPKTGSIYECKGPFKFLDLGDEDGEEDEW